MPHKLPGQTAVYRPKDPRPVTLNLTAVGRIILDNLTRKHDVSRGDAVEYLLRHHALDVSFLEERT